MASVFTLLAISAAPYRPMNAVPYHVANPAAGHDAHRFGFRNSSAYFEVYSPWIESRYSCLLYTSPSPRD